MIWPDRLGGIRRVIAVVGCQRSGTTLVGQILGAHPAAVLLDEFDGLYPWMRALAAGQDTDAALQVLLIAADAKYGEGRSRLAGAGGEARPSPQVDTLVFKAPNATFDQAAFARYPVPVVTVAACRDPRAVVASMSRLKEVDFLVNQVRLIRSHAPTAACYAQDCRLMEDPTLAPEVRRSVLWRVKTGHALQAQPTYVVRYEALARAPAPETARLAQACGLPEADEMCAPQESYRGLGPGGTDRTRPVDARSVGAWAHAFSPDGLSEILAAASPLAEALGYA